MPDPQRIVAVTSEAPWPLNSGGHLRTYHLLRAFARNFDVHLVTRAGEASAEAAMMAANIHTRFVLLRPRRRSVEVCRALKSAMRGLPYVMFAKHHYMDMQHAVNAAVTELRAGVLYLDHLDSFGYIGAAQDAVVVADLHNVYSLVARRAANESHYFRRLYLGREARLLQTIESRCAQQVDVLMTVSPQEQAHFQTVGGRDVHLIPNGVDSGHYSDLPSGRTSGRPTILYLGDLSWLPNVSAVRFLAEDVLPKVRRIIPAAELRIVGRRAGSEMVRLGRLPGVRLTGSVDDVMPHLLESHVLAVPLDSGGGTRLKILEAFAAGLPVVSTAVGIEGISADARTHFTLAERPAFAEAVTGVLLDQEGSARMATTARRLVLEQYDWHAISSRAVAVVRSAVLRHGSR